MTDRQGQPFVVRGYEPDDRVALERMYEDFEPKRSAQGLPPENGIARWLDNVLARGQHLVVDVAGEVLGHLMLMPTPDGEDTLELANFLHQSIRNRGIGTHLNRIALLLARDAGAKRVAQRGAVQLRGGALGSEVGFRRRPASLWAHEIELEEWLTTSETSNSHVSKGRTACASRDTRQTLKP